MWYYPACTADVIAAATLHKRAIADERESQGSPAIRFEILREGVEGCAEAG